MMMPKKMIGTQMMIFSTIAPTIGAGRDDPGAAREKVPRSPCTGRNAGRLNPGRPGGLGAFLEAQALLEGSFSDLEL